MAAGTSCFHIFCIFNTTLESNELSGVLINIHISVIVQQPEKGDASPSKSHSIFLRVVPSCKANAQLKGTHVFSVQVKGRTE